MSTDFNAALDQFRASAPAVAEAQTAVDAIVERELRKERPAEPAFRKFTPAVARGLRYCIASVEFDAEHEPAPLADGTPINTGVDNDDLRAAAQWLRYQLSKQEG